MTTQKYDLGNIEHNTEGWDSLLNENTQKLDDVLDNRIIGTSASAISQYDAVYLTGARAYSLALADGVKQPGVGIALEGCSAAGMSFRIQTFGVVTNAAWSWSFGSKIYLDGTTPGKLTATAPAANAQIIGIALAATSVFIFPGFGAVSASSQDSASIVASEAITKNSWVNIWNNSGTVSIRAASAASDGLYAHGYIKSAVASGVHQTVFFDGLNPVPGLTTGVAYLSAITAGGTVSSPPSGDYQVIQRVGIADASGVHTHIDAPIKLDKTAPFVKPLYVNNGIITELGTGISLSPSAVSMLRVYEEALTEQYNTDTIDWAFRAASADGVMGIALADVFSLSISAGDTTIATVAADASAMAAIAASSKCVTAIIKSTTAFNAMLASSVAMSALFGASSQVGSILNQICVLDGKATNSTLAALTTTDAVAANSTAMAAVVASALCCSYVVQSTAMMTSIAANTTAIGTWAANSTAMGKSYNAPVAAAAILGAPASVGKAIDTLDVLDGIATNSTLAAVATWAAVIADTTTSMPLICGSNRCMTMMALSSAAMATAAGSAAAMGCILSNAISREIFLGAQYSVGAGLNTYGAIGSSALAADVSMAAIVWDATGYTALFGNSTAMGKLVNSPSAMNAIASSSTACVTALCGSSVAWPLCVASSTAMTALCGSSIAMGVISISSSAMSAIIGSTTALPIFFSGAYGVGAGLNTYGALNNATLSACNKFSDVLASSAAVAAVATSTSVVTVIINLYLTLSQLIVSSNGMQQVTAVQGDCTTVANNATAKEAFLQAQYYVGKFIDQVCVAGGMATNTVLTACQTLTEVTQSNAMQQLVSNLVSQNLIRNSASFSTQIAKTADSISWSSYQSAMQGLASGVGSINDVLTIPGGSGYPTGTASFIGGVLMLDGRVFCAPNNSTTARIYNPITDSVTTPSGTYPGSGAFVGAVLLNDGRVFCIPGSSTTARIYNPITDSVTTPSGTYPGSTAYWGGVVMLDGRVFCVPCFSSSAIIYDPNSDTLITPAGAYPGNWAFQCGTLLPDGRVFCVPSCSTTARIYNPITNVLTIPNGTYPGNWAFQGGVLMRDGRVFCVPSCSTTARIYDPVNDVLSIPTGTYPGNNAFQGGVLLPDGRVFCVPNFSTTARIYDPLLDTVIIPSGTYPGNRYIWGGTLMTDGRVFCVPSGSTTARIYGGYSSMPAYNPVNFMSPFCNKF